MDKKNSTTSYGAIFVYHPKLSGAKINIDETAKISSVTTNEMIEAAKNAPCNLQFFIVSRRLSIGLLEVLRGKYDPLNAFKTTHLFKQLYANEKQYIIDILNGQMTYEDMFNKASFHGKHVTNMCEKSKNMFNKINNIRNIATTPSYYEGKEWGFPKGKKNSNENILNCIYREITEELGITDFNCIEERNDIELIKETVMGTNGVEYEQYYKVFTVNDKESFMKQLVPNYEIGEYMFVPACECISLLRKHHIEKRAIVTNLTNFFLST